MTSAGFASRLRKNMTDAERVLWSHLRRRQVEGCKFRRQCPVGPYVVDFVCFERMLVIEVDGGQHAVRQGQDAERSAGLKNHGYEVLRFWNHEVLRETEAVLEVIRSWLIRRRHIDRPLPDPPPQGEGDYS